jgi:hypothetical protein
MRARNALLLTVALLRAPLPIHTQSVLETQGSESGGPSVTVTLKLIQDSLNKLGKTTFVNQWRHQNAQVSSEISQVVATPSQCRIDFHSKSTIDGTTLFDGNDWIGFREVQNITILTAEQDFKENNPSYDGKVDPPVFFLRVQKTGEATHHSTEFVFVDGGNATLVAKTMRHAVALCSGRT